MHTYRCEKCSKVINPKKMVSLELDIRTNTYTDERVPEKFSQGSFWFGKDCAKKELKTHKNKK